MARHTPTNHDDVVDSRDILARIEELEDEQAPLVEEVERCQAVMEEQHTTDEDAEQSQEELTKAEAALEEWDGESGAELLALKAVLEEAEGYSGDRAKDGFTLIRDSYFQEYARDLADDIGAIKSDAGWPYTCIDWQEAARELQQDYTSISWDGVDYWVR